MNTAALPQFPSPIVGRPAPAKIEQLLLSAPEAAEMLGMCVRRFHQLRPTLPQPVVLGARHVRWRRADLVAWVEGLTAPTNGLPEPAQLRASRAARKRREADQLADFELSPQQRQQQRGRQQSAHPSNPTSATNDRASLGAAAQ